jgi:single-stranded-DNA-specific exonuclease
MADMRAAVERLRRAIDRKEKILIYGDYDVDGTMAVVLLLTALRSLGASVEAYIPHRLSEGYGMRASVMKRAAAEGVGVVISVDTGVREHEVIACARDLGIDCIVTDHHLPETRLPPAWAILNPRRPDCAYPEKNLAGVGVAFKLAQALLGPRLRDRALQSYLKIVALGTIADVVPLTGENRVIAHFGLAALTSIEGRSSGLPALLATAELDGRPITAGDIAFRIAPRLNAAGRMDDAGDVIELLTTSDGAKARDIAARLESLNRDRQRVEAEILSEITGLMEQNPEKAQSYSLVFSGEAWHRGVIGIVAQRLVERYYRPTLVIAIRDGVGQGSCRSIHGFHILDALTTAHHASKGEGLFDRYGGHAQAAGFSLPVSRIAELECQFEQCARAALKPDDLVPVLNVDAELDLSELDRSFYEELRALEPFGAGNPTPVFAARSLDLVLPPRVLREKHLKLRVSQGGRLLDALAWGRADTGLALAPGQKLDLAFTLDENVFGEVTTLQLIIRDLVQASSS